MNETGPSKITTIKLLLKHHSQKWYFMPITEVSFLIVLLLSIVVAHAINFMPSNN